MTFIFDSANLHSRLDDQLKKKKADVVVIDTFTDIYTGEMNQINKVRSFLENYNNLANKHQCLIVFNHHTGKGTEERIPNKNNSIGSAGFEGKARLVMELRQDYGDASKRHLCIVKGNYLGDHYKNSSFELDFDQTTGFKNTGKRKPFEDLAKPKLFKPFPNKEVEKQIVSRLYKKGRSTRTIEKILARIGKPVGKSTIAEWEKNCPSSVKS